MNTSLLVAGGGALLGVMGILATLFAQPKPLVAIDLETNSTPRSRTGVIEPFSASRHRRRQVLVYGGATGAAVVTLAVTRWPVAAVLVAVGAAGLPRLLSSLSPAGGTDRVEAVAAWTELLRDTLAAAAGLGQAIVATAELAPRTIRPTVIRLAERLTGGVPMDDALRVFALEMDDASADLVVCALLVATTAQSQKLADLLGALADSCRDQVSLRLKVESSRASARSSVRTVVLISVSFAALLFVFAHSYLSPFGSANGQIVLMAVGVCYTAGLVLMVRLVRARPPIRLLASESA